MIVVLLILGAAFLFVWQTRARIQRRRDTSGSPRERLDAIKARAEADDSRHSAMSDMEQLARRLSALLDSKAERIEILIERADQRIDQLRALEQSASSSQPADAAEIDEPPDPRAARIYELADRGYSEVEIARELAEQTGTVELVLALRRSRRNEK